MALSLRSLKVLRGCVRPTIGRALFSAEPVRAADQALILEESEGLNFALNWSLNGEDITPKDQCYGNLSAKGLLMRANGKVDGTKALHVEDSSSPLTAVPPSHHDAAFGQVASYLSEVDDLFVDDGAVGSFRGCETGIRFVTDDAALALYSQNMHVRLPAGSRGKHAITVLVAKNFPGESFHSANIEDGQAQIVFGGQTSLQTIQEVVAGVTRQIVSERDETQIPLPGNSYSDGVLAINVDGSGCDPVPASDKTLSGAHEHIWCQEGLARVFAGARYAGIPETSIGLGNLVAGGNAIAALKDSHNLADHPSQIVLLNSGSKGSLDNEAAQKELAKVVPDEHAGQIVERAAEHGIEIVSADSI